MCIRMFVQDMFVFRKIWRALFPCNTRFEIHPLALLPMKYQKFCENLCFFKNNWNLLMQIQLWYIWFSSFNKISVSALFFWNWNEKRKKLRYMKLYFIAFLQSIHTFCGSKRVLRHWLNISETSHNDEMFWPPSYLFLGKRELDIFLKS